MIDHVRAIVALAVVLVGGCRGSAAQLPSPPGPPNAQPQPRPLTVIGTDVTPKPEFHIRDFVVSGSPERGYQAAAHVVVDDPNHTLLTVFYELKSLRTGEVTTGVVEDAQIKDGSAVIHFSCGPDPCELVKTQMHGST